MDRLDPKNDLVFKLLLTRRKELLLDMLEGILARPIRDLTVANPSISGELSTDKQIVLDIRAQLDDGSRTDLEMQMRTSPELAPRLIYYTARDYSHQLRRGDAYHLLTPTVAVLWLVEPLFPELRHLHSIFELRDRATGTRFSDHLAIHLLQLSCLTPSPTTGYSVGVHRWARFLLARTDADFDQLASEHPIMRTAQQTLDQLSQDPETRRLAREREDSIKLYNMSLVASRKEGERDGLIKGRKEGERDGLIKGRKEGERDGLIKGRKEGERDGLIKGRKEGERDGLIKGRKEGERDGLIKGRKEGERNGLIKGRKEGERDGIIRGRTEGKAEVLIKLLDLRFGAVPNEARARLETARPERLDAWADRVLTATTLDEVLAP